MKIQTWFDVEGGVRFWNKLPEYKEQFEKLKDGRYLQTTERIQNQRSLEQNNAMWAIPYMFFEKVLIDSGTLINPSKTDIHEWCMVNFLPSDYRERIYEEWKLKEPVVNFRTGEKYKEAFRLTTRRMTTIDMMNYYEAMQIAYAENFSTGEDDDFIPDPDKHWKDKKKKQT